MKSLRETWHCAELWTDRYNALLAAGQANACARALRSQLDELLADIVAHHRDRPAARALRNLQGRPAQPAVVANDMDRLYAWLNTH